MERFLTVDDVSCGYDGRPVLERVTLSLDRGEFIGLLGPNGSGKTTLLRVMDGALPPSRGRVLLEGRDIGRLRRTLLARRIAVVAQENRLMFSFSAREVVMMGRFPYLKGFGFEGPRDREVCERAMELTDTLEFADRGIEELSGGERQRVFIARALAQEPDVVLFDEPTAFLDLKHQVRFFDLIHRLNEDDGLTIVTVSHDINLAAAYCRRLVLLSRGRIFRDGTPREVITEEAVGEVYGERVLVDESPVNGAPRITLAGSRARGEKNR